MKKEPVLLGEFHFLNWTFVFRTSYVFSSVEIPHVTAAIQKVIKLPCF